MRDKKLLLQLYEHPGFAAYIQLLKDARPGIPKWNTDIQQAEWIFESGYQAGFDFVLSHFEGAI